jgi:hypothetical protein
MDYDIGLSIEPNNHWLLVGRGINWTRAGKPDRAIPDLDRAILIQPENAAGFFHRSWAYRKWAMLPGPKPTGERRWHSTVERAT